MSKRTSKVKLYISLPLLIAFAGFSFFGWSMLTDYLFRTASQRAQNDAQIAYNFTLIASSDEYALTFCLYPDMFYMENTYQIALILYPYETLSAYLDRANEIIWDEKGNPKYSEPFNK